MKNSKLSIKNLILPKSMYKKRIDYALSIICKCHSRSLLQKWLKIGKITINGEIKKPHYKLAGDEIVKFQICKRHNLIKAEDIPIKIIFEDHDIMVVNKQKNIIMHPGAGNTHGTMLNALLNYNSKLQNIPRLGIVHRLDKDTSGLIVIAKNITSYLNLINQFKERTIKRTYEAIVASNSLEACGTIKTNIGRDPYNRIKMKVLSKGKEAITHFHIVEKYRLHTRIQCELETGRTHQIRVHMQYINAPIVGDKTYNKKNCSMVKKHDKMLGCKIENFQRQALHAKKLVFTHPITHNSLNFKTVVPDDIQELIIALRNDMEK